MKGVVLICGSDKRHAAYAAAIDSGVPLLAVVVEKKRTQILSKSLTPEVVEHLEQRGREEENYFGEYSFDALTCPTFFIDTGTASSIVVFEWVNNFSPDYILLYGSSIIKDPILSAYKNKIINLHLGLSPYYKGAATLFWPIAYNEIQCIGTTFHLASMKVDDGAIIHQLRPILEPEDTIYTCGCKAMLASFRVAPEVIKNYWDNGNSVSLYSNESKEREKVFRMKDFNEEALITAKNNILNGVIRTYIEEKESTDYLYPIISCF